MARKKRRRRVVSRPYSSINITSLGDISLSLLLGFLVITPVVIETISSTLPRSGVGPSSGEVKQDVVVVLTAEGKVLVNGEEVGEEGLPSKLDELFPPGAERKVLFTGAAEVGYDRVVHIMDLLKENGVEKIGIR